VDEYTINEAKQAIREAGERLRRVEQARREIQVAGARLRLVEAERVATIAIVRDALNTGEAAGVNPREFFELMGMRGKEDAAAKLARRILRDRQRKEYKSGA
jgi:acyl-homoserine lactone acylase PvdQ